MRMRNNYIILACIVIIGFILRVISLDKGLGYSDENIYYEAGLKIIHNPSYILTLTVIHTHPPLHWIYSISGIYGIIYMRYVSAIIGTLCILVLYYYIKKNIGETEALISACLISICGYYVMLSRIAYPSMLIILFFIVLVFQFWEFVKNPTLRNSLLYGLILTITILLKEPAILFIPATLLYLIWDRKVLIKNKNYWIGTLFPFIVLIPVLLYAFYFILPNYIQGLSLVELPKFYQVYLNRGIHPEFFLTGIYYVFGVFEKFSSILMVDLVLIGLGYSLYEPKSLNKLMLVITIVYLIFFSMMYNKSVEGFIDWHVKWIYLPMLILSSSFIADFIKLEKLRQYVVLIMFSFVLLVIYSDLITINLMNRFMVDNYGALPLIQTDTKLDSILGLFNASRV